jgi:hypothetical protein
MRTLFALVVIGWLPGAVLFRAPFLERERRAALPAEERWYWAVVLSLALSLAIVLALAAIHRYSFGRLLTADLVVAALVALGSRFDLRLGATARRPGAGVLVPLALVVLAAWRFFPPSEYIIGGKDPGVYVSEGIQIAQRGALWLHDPVVASVPTFARDLFFPPDRNINHYVAVRFMGYFVVNPDSGAVVGQFPQLVPASIAIGYGLAGLTGARETVGVWALLGVLAVYFLAARLVGRAAAAAAAGLLTLNVIQVWFARYPNAEVVMQTLVFAALLATARGQVDDDPFFSPVAGTLLGLLLFLRIDTVIAVGAVVAAVALGYVAGRRVRWTFWPPLAAATVLAGWYYLGPLRDYMEIPIVFVLRQPAWHFAAIGAAAIGLALLVAAARRSAAWSTRVVHYLPTALTIVIVALAVYALWFRHPGGKLTDYDAYALRMFAGFYFTLPALIAALIGYAFVIRARFWEDPAFAVTLVAFSLVFFYKIRIVPEHFWAARRFLAVILPGALVCVSAAALTGLRGRGPFGKAIRLPIGIVFLALVALSYERAARPVLDHIEYAGVIARLEALAGRIGDRDLLVVESRDAGSDVHVFGLPLAYIYGRNVLTLSNAKPDKVAFGAFLNQMHAQYDRVLFLGGGGTDLLSSRWSVTPIQSDRFQVPEYDSPRNAYPRFVRRKEFDYSLYAFAPPPMTPPPSVLDVGVNDDLNVNRFHAKEETEGRTFRWSQKQSVLIVNPIQPGSRTIALWMSNGGRPPAAPPADVAVLLNDVPLGTVRVENGFREYDIGIPPAVAAAAAATGEPVRIMLRTPTWNPMKVLGTGDDNRELGVMVDRVAVR